MYIISILAKQYNKTERHSILSSYSVNEYSVMNILLEKNCHFESSLQRIFSFNTDIRLQIGFCRRHNADTVLRAVAGGRPSWIWSARRTW